MSVLKTPIFNRSTLGKAGKWLAPTAAAIAVPQAASGYLAASGDGELSTLPQIGIGAAAAYATSPLVRAPMRRMARGMIIPSILATYMFKRQKQNFGGALTDPNTVQKLTDKYGSESIKRMIDSIRNNQKFQDFLGYQQPGATNAGKSPFADRY